jgi:hypothetical protein
MKHGLNTDKSANQNGLNDLPLSVIQPLEFRASRAHFHERKKFEPLMYANKKLMVGFQTY